MLARGIGFPHVSKAQPGLCMDSGRWVLADQLLDRLNALYGLETVPITVGLFLDIIHGSAK